MNIFRFKIMILMALLLTFSFQNISGQEKSFCVLAPEVNDKTSKPIVARENDFIKIEDMWFVHRGEKEFRLNFNRGEKTIELNGIQRTVIIHESSDLKNITPETDHVVCSIKLSNRIIDALSNITRPFFLETFAQYALESVNNLSTLKNMTHLKLSFGTIWLLGSYGYSEENPVTKIDLTPFNKIKCPYLMIDNNGVEIKLPTRSCTDLILKTENDNITKDIALMPGLRRLDFYRTNTISKDILLPITNLNNLRRFNIYAKSLDINALGLIYEMQQLEHIGINCNRDVEVFNFAGFPNLVSLKVSGKIIKGHTKDPASGFKNLLYIQDYTADMLDSFESEGIQLDSLKALYLDYNKSRNSNVFKGMRNLEYLVFYSYHPEKLKEISSFKKLKYLSFHGPDINDSHMHYLSGHPSLENIDISFDKISSDGVKELEGLPHLKKLNLMGTKVTNSALKSIGSMNSLTHLNLMYSLVFNAQVYRSKESINKLIAERLKVESLPKIFFKSYLLQKIGKYKKTKEGFDGPESFDCSYNYSPMKDYVIYLLNGFASYFNKSFNFHNGRSKADEEMLNSFIKEKTGFDLILSRKQYKPGILNSYNKKAIRKIYEMAKLSSSDLIEKDTAGVIYKSLLYKAVRNKVLDVLRLMKDEENLNLMVEFYRKKLHSVESGTDAQDQTWKEFIGNKNEGCKDYANKEILGFLLRREMDGTLPEILDIILDFLEDYDPEFFDRVNIPLSRFTGKVKPEKSHTKIGVLAGPDKFKFEILKRDNYKFPLVIRNNDIPSTKINRYLQIKTFEGLTKNKELKEIEGVSDLDHSIETNNEKILSVGIFTEYCSAYCSQNSFHYNFDSKTGNIFFMEDLFTKEGLEKLKDLLIEEREKRIKKEISINRAMFSKGEGDKEEIKEQYELYQRCLESNRSKSKHYFRDFFIKDGAVYFLRQRCSPHVLRAIDEVGSFLNKKTFKELIPFLSDYGNYILLNEGKVELNGLSEKVLLGNVAGKYPVTMLLTIENKRVYGSYFYDKFGKMIELRGKMTDKDNIYLEELNNKRKVTATITLKINGNLLLGEWENRSNRKKLSILLEN